MTGMDVNTKADYFQENVEEYRYFNAHNEVNSEHILKFASSS